MRRITADFPAECILISHGCTTGCIDIILAACSTTYNGFYWPCSHIRLCIGIARQYIVSLGNCSITSSKGCLHSVKILLRVQTSRMNETSVVIEESLIFSSYNVHSFCCNHLIVSRLQGGLPTVEQCLRSLFLVHQLFYNGNIIIPFIHDGLGIICR